MKRERTQFTMENLIKRYLTLGTFYKYLCGTTKRQCVVCVLYTILKFLHPVGNSEGSKVHYQGCITGGMGVEMTLVSENQGKNILKIGYAVRIFVRPLVSIPTRKSCRIGGPESRWFGFQRTEIVLGIRFVSEKKKLL